MPLAWAWASPPMLLYHIVTYRLDTALLCALTIGALGACRAIVHARRPGNPHLPRAIKYITALLVLAGAGLAELAEHRQRTFLMSVFAGFGPTYAHDLQKAGHAKVTFDTPADDPTYLRLIERQKDWLRLNPLIADVYTVRMDGAGGMRFVVDSETDYDRNGRIEGEREQRTRIGELYPETTPPFFEALAGRVVFDDEIVADRWGVWVSSMAPLFNDQGGIDGAVGVDYPAAEWIGAIALRRALVLASALVLAVLLLSSGSLVTLMRTEIAQRASAQRELEKAKEAADAANRAKGEFLAVMSHEIRTPLTAITGYASMLEDTPLDALQQRYVRTMRRGAGTLVDLLNNILDYSKIEEGKLELEMLPCIPADIIREVLELFAPAAREKGIALHFDNRVDGELVIEGDQARLRQIVTNLVGNAVKFTSEGEVVATLLWAPAVAGHETGNLEVTVRDTGPGIAPEKLPKLFRMFAQADAGTARRYGGSGLGLAISRSLVEMMHGRITVRSSPGAGSDFAFSVPCRRIIRAADASQPRGITDVPGISARLLVVDDNESNRDVLCALLQPAGFEVEIARSGQAAVELASRNSYAAILMDVSMPDMDGLAATRAIRAASPLVRTPIVAVTAGTTKADRLACEAAGMDDFIPKPVDQRRLLDVIARLCGRPASASA